MAKFKKKIVRPGTPTVGRLDGSEEKEALTPSRLKTWVENTKKLQALGVLIPGPLAHQDKNKRLAFPVIKAKDGETLADAYSGATPEIPPAWDLANLNAGFWDDFEIDPSDNSIVGTLNAENQSKSDMIGKDVKQTSVFVMPSRRITDGEGKEHEIGEHFAHVAVCLHAQEPGQENFVPIAPIAPLTPMPTAMAMSFVLAMDEMMGDAGGTSNIRDDSGGLPQNPNTPKDPELYAVISLLRSAKNLAIPEDTTRENFLQVLKIVLTQALASDQESEKEESLTNRPDDGQTRTPSIAMSKTIQTDAPKTDSATAILMSMLVKDKKKGLKERIQKLVNSGRVGKKYADENLFPKADAFSMSASDLNESGEFPKGSLEDLIEGLEQATPLVGESLIDSGNGLNDVPTDADVQDMPQDVITGTAVNDLSEKQMDDMMEAFAV